MLTDLVGGQIQFAFDSLGSTLPLIRSGKIKAIAVTGQQRLAIHRRGPDDGRSRLPAVATDVWIGLFVPAKTPKNVIDALHAETVQILNMPESAARLSTDRSINPIGNSAEAFKSEIQVETQKKRDLAARIGIKAE